MLIVVGEHFSSQWDKTPQREPGQCRVCQQKDAMKLVIDHVHFVGKKALHGMTGELCIHCLNFQGDEESQKVIDHETLRYVSIVQRQMIRNTQNIRARWQARKLRRAIQDQSSPKTVRKM